MNPLEFKWTEDQQVTVTNPTSETYIFKVHGKEYQLAAGQTAKMPGYIAWIYVYGQSVKMSQANGEFNRWNEEGFRQTYYDKFVAGVDNLVQTVPVERPLVEVLEQEDEIVEPDSLPPAGTGSSYTPQVKEKTRRGRPART